MIDRMKANVLYDIDNLVFEEIELPILQDDEVLVKVQKAGICGSDIPRIYTTGAHVHPLIPGHEFAGTVVDARESKKWQDKRVGIFPLIPCKECPQCKRKKYEMCRNYSYLGSRRDGGFAEYVAVPVWNLLELNDNISFEQAAMLEPMAVAVHAMRQIDINRDDNIVVCGLGTIGLLLVMFLKEAGYNNIKVIGNKDFQKEKSIQIGIEKEDFIDCRLENVTERIKDVNVFFECVGKDNTIVQAVDLIAPSGKIVLVGNPASDIQFEKNTYWKILRNQLTIKGTWNSSYTGDVSDDWHYVLDKLKENRIKPEQLISHVFTIDNLRKGLEIMKNKSEDYVKIMVEYT